MKLRLLGIFLILLVLTLAACGGGSAGTGTTTLNGKVRNLQDVPISDVLVTILNTGDSATTNSNGEFRITTPASKQIQLEVQSPNGKDQVLIPDQEGPVTQIDVQIKVDPDSGKIQEFGEISISAGIYGACDHFFENAQVIRQANALGTGTICTIKVWLTEDGKPKGAVPIGLEAAGCAEILPWTLENQVESSARGVTQIQFEFKNDAAHCQYRIVAPYIKNAKNQKQIYIHSLNKQAYDEQFTN